MRQISFLFLLLLASCLSTAQVSERGYIDLSSYRFDQNEPVELIGEWLFYPSQYLSEGTHEDSLFIQAPSYWKSQGLPNRGFGTYKLVLILPKSMPMGVRIPNINGAYKFYVDGKLVSQKGDPGKTKATTTPYRQSKVLPFISASDTVVFTLEVANFYHSRGGMDRALKLGEYDQLRKRKFMEDMMDAFLAGCLVMGAFFFLGLYFFGSHNKEVLFFALFCLFYAYRVVGWGNYILHDLLYIPYSLSIRLEYVSLYLCCLFFALYVKKLFPDEYPRFLFTSFIILTGVWALGTLLPIAIFTQLNYIYLLLLLVGILIIVWIYIRAWIKGRIGANYSIYSTSGLLVVFALKTMAYFHWIEEPWLITLAGQLVFFFFQSLILSDRFALSWKNAKEQAEKSAKELKTAQNQIVESEKMALIGIMTAGLAHELNNPLNIIGGVIDPIKRDLLDIQNSLNEKDKKSTASSFVEINDLLNHVALSSKRASLVIRNLLDITPKNREGKQQVVDLKELIESTTLLVKKGQHKVEIHVKIEENLLVYGNPVELNQVFLNLISNSLDALNDIEKPQISIEGLTEKDTVILKFQDNGYGMSQETQQKIFEPFYTTKISKGTGLGLYISRTMVLKHNGNIHVESKKGEGSLFVISLPKYQNNAE